MRAHGGEVVDVEFKSEGGGWILRVFVEKQGSADRKASTKDGAIDIDACAKIARDLSPALDVVDLVAHRYNLEVSTPGVERPLRNAADFIRFAGEKAKVKLETPVSGQKVLVGILGDCKDGRCTIVDGSREFEFEIADVSSARLVFEFGPAAKPGKQKGAPATKRPPSISPPEAGSPPASKRVPR